MWYLFHSTSAMTKLLAFLVFCSQPNVAHFSALKTNNKVVGSLTVWQSFKRLAS
jgi:hypothetical protein